MKNVLIIAAILLSLSAKSQVSKVSLQASGLTCSMCSNAINKALKSVDFVENVDANIKTSTFEITFKPNAKIDFDKLKSKVEGAGFFVAGFFVTVHLENVDATPGQTLVVDNNTFQFVHPLDHALNGETSLKIIDRGFVSVKEYKKNAAAIEEQGGSKSVPCYDIEKPARSLV